MKLIPSFHLTKTVLNSGATSARLPLTAPLLERHVHPRRHHRERRSRRSRELAGDHIAPTSPPRRMRSRFQRALIVGLLLLLIFGATFSHAPTPLQMSTHSITADHALAELAALQSQLESGRKQNPLGGGSASVVQPDGAPEGSGG